jgi:RimJ/RimL family protein N-acetyltransferase
MNSQDLILRAVSAADLPILYAQQRDPDAVRMAAFPSRSLEAFMAHWKKIMDMQGPVLRAIEIRGEVAGNILCWEANGDWNIGYWIGKTYWGQGIATAALRAMAAELAQRPLTARVSANNFPSIRVLEKCGFTIAGTDKFLSPEGKTMEELIFTLKK